MSFRSCIWSAVFGSSCWLWGSSVALAQGAPATAEPVGVAAPPAAALATPPATGDAASVAPAPSPKLERDEKGRPKGRFATVLLGLDTTFWGIEWGDSSDSYRGSLGGYDRTTSPFVLKTLEVKLHDLWGVEAGLNYVTDKLTKLGGFGGDDLAAPDEPVSRAITGYLSGHPIEGLTLRSSLTLRRFESTATARGRESASGPPLAQTYLPSEGAPAVILPGQEVTWFSQTRDFSLDVGVSFFFVGYRSLDILTPTDVFLVDSADSVLVGTHNTCNAVEGGVGSADDGAPQPGWDVRGKLWVLWGAYGMHNQYFDTSGGYCMGFGAELGAQYNSEQLSVDFGLRGMEMTMASDPEGAQTTLKQSMPIVDLLGNPAVLPAGSTITPDVSRFERMGGPYVRVAWGL